MAEENYAHQLPAVSRDAGIDEQHTRRQTRPPGEAKILESTGQQQRKNLRVSHRVPVSHGGFWNEAKQRLDTLKQDTDDYVQDNPTKAVFIALAIGFVLALVRRR